MLPIRKILCPTDFSEPSYKGVAVAEELAAHFGAELILVTAVEPVHFAMEAEYPTKDWAENLQKEMVRQAASSLEKVKKEKISAGIPTRLSVVYGNAAEEITGLAKKEGVDLLVIATHGWTGWRRLVFGSVAERVVRIAGCPVLTVTGPADQ